MKLLLDENLPKRLKGDLSPHVAFTVRDMGWNGKSNGDLLQLMKQHHFEALLTFDRNMAYQQNFTRYDLPVIVLDADDNTYGTLRALISEVMRVIE